MLTVSEPDSSLSLKGHPTTIHPQIPWIQQLGTAKDDRAYSGDRLGGFQFGSTAADAPFGMTVDDAGRVYVGGWTLGDLGGSSTLLEQPRVI